MKLDGKNNLLWRNFEISVIFREMLQYNSMVLKGLLYDMFY